LLQKKLSPTRKGEINKNRQPGRRESQLLTLEKVRSYGIIDRERGDMKRIQKAALFSTVIILVQMCVHPENPLVGTSKLLPETNVSLTESKLVFREMYDCLCTGLLIYKLDAMQRFSKTDIQDVVFTECLNAESRSPAVNFDLDNIDIGKKGWTRYYPFKAKGRFYILRIFRTEEREYQTQATILFEGDAKNLGLTLQVLPGLNAILGRDSIKPFSLKFSNEASTSP
jgi:hypothetical protein